MMLAELDVDKEAGDRVDTSTRQIEQALARLEQQDISGKIEDRANNLAFAAVALAVSDSIAM